MINKGKKLERDQVSDNLNEALVKKDPDTFWKLWKKKFGSKTRKSNIIEGCTDEIEIAGKFADFFFLGGDGNVEKDRAKKKKLSDLLDSYQGDTFDLVAVNVELIDTFISSLKKGKAAGSDNISAEHLKFAHPLVRCTLVILFKIMINIGYVPDAFGEGVTIPIPKGDKNRVFDKLEDFRGITISSVISKKI